MVNINHPLSEKFYNRSTEIVAKELLGKYLVRNENCEKYIGKIVETEAYLGEEDPAAHAAKGKTKRTEILHGKPGLAYIFQIHRYHCLNVVTEIDKPACVLFRALEPVTTNLENTDGPGKLCLAMNITKELYGTNMTMSTSPLYIAENDEKVEIVTSPRIGITKAADWPLRFFIKDNPYVSR